jgi:mono/diheme cytochrome c family protein
MRPTVARAMAAVIVAGVLVALAGSDAMVVAGQGEAARVFTAEQASVGKTAYAGACARCHMPDLGGTPDAAALAGSTFVETWRGRSTKDLFDFVSGSMPPGGSSMSSETYAAIVAFVLQSNGAASGTTGLEPSTAVPLERVLRAPSP